MSEAGHNCVGACEIDSYARLIYAKQFPGVRIWEDATKLDPKELPDFDVLTGGFPCQAFSIAGKRKGFDDTRGSMFFEIARIAKEKRPRYLLLENVKGLLNHDQGNTFRVIISTLDEMGYDAEWQVLNSKYFVPQNRERVFIVGHLRGKRTRKIFPLGENNKEAIESKLKRIKGNPNVYNTDAQAGKIYDITGISPTVSDQRVNSQGFIAVTKDHGELRQTKDESLAIDANYWKGPDNHGQRTMIYMAHSKGNIKQRIQDRKESWTLSNNSNDFGVIEPVIVADRSRTYADKGRNLESPKKICNSLTSVAKDNYVMQKEKPIKEFGIIDDDGRKISNAIRRGGRGSVDRHSWDIVNDKMRIRRLTPKECERLQGFPDDWTKYDKDGNVISDTQRYKCCGNAVTVPVVKFVAENLS